MEGNAYFIDYRIDGRRRRKSVGRSKKIAELALKDFEVKIAKRELGFEKKDNAKQLKEKIEALIDIRDKELGGNMILNYDEIHKKYMELAQQILKNNDKEFKIETIDGEHLE